MKKILFSFFLMSSVAHAQETEHPLDEFYSPEEMAMSRAMVKNMHGGTNFLFLMADRLEYQTADDGALAWELQGYYGGDHERVWFESEAELDFGTDEFHEGDVSVKYGRAISPFFDFQAASNRISTRDQSAHMLPWVSWGLRHTGLKLIAILKSVTKATSPLILKWNMSFS